MENWIEHHTGLPQAMRMALEMLAVSGGLHLVLAGRRVHSGPARIVCQLCLANL